MAMNYDSVGGFCYNYEHYKAEFDETNDQIFFHIPTYTTFFPGSNCINSGIFPLRDSFDKLDIFSALADSTSSIILYDIFVDSKGELMFVFINSECEEYINEKPIYVGILLE